MKLSIHVGGILALGNVSDVASAPANEADIVMIPKYRQNNHEQMVLGARFAQDEIGAADVVGWYPLREKSRADQISMVQNATALGVAAIMMANNAGRDIEEHTLEANQIGLPIVTYDSPLKGGRDAGESLFVAPVDFRFTGIAMADMALSILGEDGGDFVILSTTPHAANQNAWIAAMIETIEEDEKYAVLNLVGDGVCWPSVDNAEGYRERTLELVELQKNGTYPNLSLIMAPTTSGAAAAAQALHDHGHCDTVQVSGLAVPAEMLKVSQAGCAPEFAFFNSLDVGYLAYHATHALLSGQIEGKEGEIIQAGRLNSRTIEVDPTRDNAVRVLLGDFTKYDAENVERAAFIECIMQFCGNTEEYFEERFMEKYRKKALAIIPKITGMISFLCSAFLVQHILRSRKRRGEVYKRIILGISLSDLLSSFFGFFLSTWPMPSDTWLAYGASGSTQSCSMQGFLFQLGICSTTLYQSSLVLYFFFTIACGWERTRITKWEPFLHITPCAVGLSTAVAGLVLRLYNPLSRGSLCWIEEYPPYCGNSLSCERGEGATKYRWGFTYGFVVATFVWMAFAMTMICHKVRKTEKKVEKYRYGNSDQHNKSREVAVQTFLYILAYSIPWVWGLIISSIDTAQNVFESGAHDDAITALNIVNAVVFPLQGFFNVLVYVRPRYKKARRKHPDSNIFQLFGRAFSSSDQYDSKLHFSRSLLFRSLSTKRTSFFVSRSFRRCSSKNSLGSANKENPADDNAKKGEAEGLSSTTNKKDEEYFEEDCIDC